ncbi:hypothetical protein Kpho02_64350 [Kitasatospora phosalacinea]|uniref:Uncharacterized protein n=1 Tax=Kitasatospora phosalacinea TaxID=2065 RepID=A0A9W6QC82_9ACTN|nr:DUF6585 family protein [Kitasatospora phosalacinea]GLW74137.1 hypothetical protein Kpho02_64350 [Kitasatospora phosalacinea]
MPDTVPAAPPPPLPPALAELAEQHGLGALTATFRPQKFGVLIKTSFYVTLAVLLFLFVVPAVVFYYVSLRRTPDFNPRQAAKRLHLFEHGLVVDDERGPGRTVVRWDEARLYEEQTRNVINGVPGPVMYTCVLRTPGASAVVTQFYQHPRVWSQAMQQAVLRAQGDRAQRAFLAGEVLDFGEFDLSSAGIAHRKQLLPWDRLAGVELRGGAVLLLQDGEPAPWARAAAGSVPNLHLFLALVEAHRAD